MTNATMVNDGYCAACDRPLPIGTRCYVFVTILGRLATICSGVCKGKELKKESLTSSSS